MVKVLEVEFNKVQKIYGILHIALSELNTCYTMLEGEEFESILACQLCAASVDISNLLFDISEGTSAILDEINVEGL